ncbi:helix-turn-helix protein [Acinetobacter calcoaceticus]|uniref:Helix-turn-helix protein n=1 Tax=Acinetobacter calcoaceticus TaxID=471 RepID=A0A4R1Y0A4_ACICA|nr:helix-turn-helix protein [Acinetobacter calcoaceticus]
MDLHHHWTYSSQFPPFYAEQPFFKKRMKYHQHCHIHSKVIAEFYKIECSATHPPILVIPDGCIDIIFECDPNNPTAQICGSSLNTHEVPMQANTAYFGIRFLPGIVPKFIQSSAESILNQSIDFNELVPFETQLVENIGLEGNIEKQIFIFLNAFSSQLTRQYSLTTEYILHAVIYHNPQLKIKDLERSTGYCARHIQRIFKQDVGMSIKEFSCIIRFQYAIHALNLPHIPKLSELTYALGYNDQAHFHKEFKKFSNMSPTRFVKYLETFH